MYKRIIIINSIKIAFILSSISVTGSLFFSEVLGYTPCSLCWWQRICMYPLVILLGMGIVKKDKNIVSYALPLSIIGTVIAFYHNLLYYEIVFRNAISCVPEVSCIEKYITAFGFLSIPLMSLISFSLITICLSLSMKYQTNSTGPK